jgi:D-galactarolactone cycloisomerase
MRIARLESRRYLLPLVPAFDAAWDPEPRRHFEETIVMVETDDGIRGWAGGAPVPDLDLLSSLLVGTRLDDTARVLRCCRRVDFHHGRNWSVEVAVFDALARSREQPLWQLLGGRRRSLPVYASTGERIDPGERVERSLRWKEAGIRALKLRFYHPNWRDDLAIAEAVRSAVGDEVDLMVDANQGWRMPGDDHSPWDLATAIDCAKALAELDVYWLEEPLPTDRVDDYASLRQAAEVKIAGGEMVRSLAETERLIRAGAFDVVQNDVILAGGIGGARMVAGWAKEAGIVWSPHTWTTGLGLLANLHAALAYSTAEYLEVPFDPPGWSPQRRDFMMPAPLPIRPDGEIEVPSGPGLGLVPDLDALESYRVG